MGDGTRYGWYTYRNSKYLETATTEVMTPPPPISQLMWSDFDGTNMILKSKNRLGSRNWCFK